MNAAIRVRQVVDWGAAVWTGILSGTLFLNLVVVLPWITLGDSWVHVRLIASLGLGPDVVPPQDAINPLVPVALILTYALALLFAAVVAVVVHRWGWILNSVGGVLLGLSLYLINFWTLSFSPGSTRCETGCFSWHTSPSARRRESSWN